MFAIIGIVIVLGAVVGGYLMENGNLAVLWQPAELVIIFGAAVGSLVIASPKKVLGMLVTEIKNIFLGAPMKKQHYMELLLLLNLLFAKIRTDGAISIESDIENPDKSPIFSNFKSVMHNHHALHFICDNFRVFITIGMEPHEFDNLMEIDMDALHHEELMPVGALNRTADSLPGLGIVAAVLGVVLTMGKISEPPEVLGHHIGAALVGTFLGILFCYGFLGPMAANMENRVHEQSTFLRVIRATLVSFIANSVPQIAVEAGRRAIPGKERPSFQELEEEIKKLKKK